MRRVLGLSIAACLLVGCASTETGTVSYREDGTKVYGLPEHPQASTVAAGTVMQGAYDAGVPSTGQFTGKNRTADVIGQYPVVPGEADVRELARSTPQDRERVLSRPGEGAGTLGQAGIQPGRSVSSATIMTPPQPSNRSELPESEKSTESQTPASPEEANVQDDPNLGIGAGPIGESSSGSSDNISSNSTNRENSRPIEILNRVETSKLTVAGLPERIREALRTKEAETIGLSFSEIKKLEIETVNGNVTLAGSVENKDQKDFIESKVIEIEGVKSLNNQLQTKSSASTDLPEPIVP